MNEPTARGFKSLRAPAMVLHMRRSRMIANLCLIGALGAALSLAACGRKSGLDLPPSASAAPAASTASSTAAAAEPQKEAEARSLTSPLAKPPKPQPRVVPQRSLPIDVLLN